MKIEIVEKYKSIQTLQWNDIPQLAVITGQNGVGKTQLLQLIYLKILGDKKIDNLIKIEDIEYLPHQVNHIGDWQLDDTSTISIANNITTIEQEYNNFTNNRSNIANIDLKNDAVINRKKMISHIVQHPSGRNISLEDYKKSSNALFPHRALAKNIEKLFLDWRTEEINLRADGHDSSQIKEKIGEKPWEVLKKIINNAELPFKFNNPDKTRIADKFKLQMTHTRNGEEIDFSALSSGEKTLLSLIFYLYHSEKTPYKILLFDEPDAHLHPGMSKYFLKIIEETFVKKLGIRVIMTTHSPCTVALCPPEALFEMIYEPPRIKKAASLNSTIFNLTSGSLYVNKMTKYILVEDNDDAEFYNYLYDQLRSEKCINMDITLQFISVSTRKSKLEGRSGGKTVVRGLIENFMAVGADAIFGLVDRDDKEEENPNVFQIKRYSIENYLIDPILIYATLVENNIKLDIDISHDLHSITKIKQESEKNLQKIADHIISLIRFENKEEEDIKIPFINGKTIKYPSWIINMKGKNIIAQCGSVNDFKGKINHGNLLKSLKRTQFITADFIDLFKSMHNCIINNSEHS